MAGEAHMATFQIVSAATNSAVSCLQNFEQLGG